MRIDAVIFDMDGLLVDSEPVWDAARADLAAQHGVDWTQDDHRNVMGVSTEEWAIYMIERFNADLTIEEMQQRVIAEMVAMYSERIPFFPGAIEAVKSAAARYPCGMASGSPRQLIDIVTNDPVLAGCFQVILAADEVGVGKPAPDVYLVTAARMGVSPDRCVCIEDSGGGILSGKRAGMKVIAIPDSRFPPKPEYVEQADLVLNSLTDFSVDLLERL